MQDNCCAFTGHRPHKFPWKYDETGSQCVVLKAALREQIIGLVEAGVTDSFSGGADGVDCWAALIVLDLRKIILSFGSIPHKGQADTVEFVSREYYDEYMFERNHRLVETAGLLLVIYNGERRGGTAATVRYARKLGRGIILDPITLETAS